MKQYLLHLLLITLCSSVFAQGQKMTRQQYIDTYAPIAVKEMYKSGIPASITIAQGILESGDGNSRLATEGNNHFGIKCHKEWNGKRIYHDDDELQECFRVYADPYQSYKDHSEFLLSRPWYAPLFKLDIHDYKAWAHGLKKAGYATNPKYAFLLIKLIEDNDLARYDRMPADHFEQLAKADKKAKDNKAAEKKALALNEKKMTTSNHLGKPVIPNKQEVDRTQSIQEPKRSAYRKFKKQFFRINGVLATAAQEGDNPLQVAVRCKLDAAKVAKYNDMAINDGFEAGAYVFIEPKKSKANKTYHTVRDLETMHHIAQLYGVKLKQLYKYNLMNYSDQPVPGQKLYLSAKRSEPIRYLSYKEWVRRYKVCDNT